MRYLIIQFSFSCLKAGNLPLYKGSTLRGAFGHALKNQECQNPQLDDCNECELAESCFFRSMYGAECSYINSMKNVPRPYVFRSENYEASFDESSSFQAEVVVFESMMINIPTIVQAMKTAAINGFGAKKVPFSLETAVLQGAGWQKQVEDDFSFAMIHGQPYTISIPEETDHNETVAGVFQILSPVNIKTRSLSGKQMRPESFLKAIIRRVSAISRFWGNDEWSVLPFAELYKKLDGTRLLDSDLMWCDFKRYSSRQKRSFPVEGFVGQFEIENIPLMLLETLAALDDIHVGKGAAWGLGRVKAVGFY